MKNDPFLHDPGTPDSEISQLRLSGRMAHRRGMILGQRRPGELPLPAIGQPGRAEWWLGWYDERLGHFFGRPAIATLWVSLCLLGCLGCEIRSEDSPPNPPPPANCPAPCPDGRCPVAVTSLAEVPLEIRDHNYGGGSCMYASLCTALRWQGQDAAADRIRAAYRGGQGVDGLSKICKAEGIQFAATVDGDEELLEWCSRTRRMAAIHFFPKHAVTFAGYENGQAVLIDNNHIKANIRIPKQVFIAQWHGYGGCALVPIYTPPSPAAH